MPSPNFTGNDPLTTARLSLSNGDHALGRLAFMLSGNRLLVSVLGFDRPGILAYLTEKFFRAGASIEACFGRRLARGVGSYFEITADSQDTLKRLCQEFMTDDMGFPDRERVTPARFFDLEVLMRRDQKGLLYAVSDVLSRHGVNVSHFTADKADDFLMDMDSTLAAGGEPLAWQVHMLARLEMPEGTDDEFLKEEMLARLPKGTEVNLTERPLDLTPEELLSNA
jgi:predicted amino acid-binding ACT domain protein